MSAIAPLISDLAIILVAAGCSTLVFKGLRQPVILGYIVAGVLAGPSVSFIPTISDASSIRVWADIGVIFLLFAMGLEFSFRKLLSVGGTAVTAAVTIVAGMMFVGYGTGMSLGFSHMSSIFLGGMLSMSSTAIVFKAFDDMGLRGQRFTGVVLGILVVEDLVGVVLMVLLSPLLHLVPRKTTAEAGCGGWLCALAALVPLLLFAWILEGILHRGRPGEGIGEITLRALGPVAGRVLLGVYALWFLLYSAFALRIGAERFIEAVFPLSRPWPFVVTILAMAVCGALGSTKALFRASEIFLPLLMLVLALVLVFAVPGLNVNNLLPVTAQDLPGVARSGLTVFGIGAAVLFFGAFTGGRTPPAPGQGRAAVWWCVRMCVLVTLLSAFAIGILGAELTAKLTHPFFTMLRNVSLFHAVERFGALVIGLWVLPDFVLVSMLLTLAVNCLRAACSRDGRLFAQKNPPALVLLCAAAAGAGALFLAQNAFETDALQASVVPVVNIVLLGVGTVGMYLIGRARGKI